MPFLEPPVIARRELDGFVELTFGSPELAGAARPGQYVLAQTALPDSFDPLLPHPLFVAAANPADGTVSFLLPADHVQSARLAERRLGARISLFGPLGTPFEIDQSTRQLLLAGGGAAMPALIFLANWATLRRIAVVLLISDTSQHLPSPLLLPPDVEYQRSSDGQSALLELLGGSSQPGSFAFDAPLRWADQCCFSVEPALLAPLSNAVRAARLRWNRGFAQVLIHGMMPCGTGACQACLIETRNGLRTRCKDGPVFDLREL